MERGFNRNEAALLKGLESASWLKQQILFLVPQDK